MSGVLSRVPRVQQELFEPFGRMGADALEDVAEVGERGDLQSLAGGDEAGEDRHSC